MYSHTHTHTHLLRCRKHNEVFAGKTLRNYHCIVISNTQYCFGKQTQSYCFGKQTQSYRIETQVHKTSEVDLAEGSATWSEQHLLSPTIEKRLKRNALCSEDQCWRSCQDRSWAGHLCLLSMALLLPRINGSLVKASLADSRPGTVTGWGKICL